MPAHGRRYRIASVADMEAMLDDLRIRDGFALLGDIGCMVAMGVCPMALFGTFELEAFGLARMVRSGGPWPWTGNYYDQPAVFARATSVIGSELTVIASEEQSLGKQ